MTWLTGQTTWGSLVALLPQLICGETADGLGTTCAAGDRWVRDIDTSHATIRSPASADVTIGGAGRCGYWNAWQPKTQTSIQVTSAMSGSSLSSSASRFQRVWVILQITALNTVAGNYSTASVQYYFIDPDRQTVGTDSSFYGGVVWAPQLYLASGSVTPSAGGTITLPWGLQAQLSDPSGFLTFGSYGRGFTSAFLYGIDQWPFYARRSGAPTFSTAPAGVSGTDYALVDQVVPSGIGVSPQGGALQGNVNIPSSFNNHWGGGFSGIGIMTATPLGSRYVITQPTAAIKCAIVAGSANNGTLDLFFGPAPLDTVNGNIIRPSGGGYISSWMTCATTAVTGTTVQYWLSVKPTGITIALNADPGNGGGMGVQYIGNLTPGSYFSTEEVFPVITGWSPTQGNTLVANQNVNGINVGVGPVISQIPWRRQRAHQDGTEAPRDWQTGWLRSDTGYSMAGSWLYPMDFAISNGAQVGSYGPFSMAKPAWDGKWWMFGSVFTEETNQATTYRGSMSDRWLMLPSGNFGNADELTDTGTGTKYFLCVPSWNSLPGVSSPGQPSSSAIAIVEA